MLVRWNLTVCSVTQRSEAIAELDRPRATALMIVRSRRRLGHHLEAAVAFENAPHPHPYERMIVRKQYPHRSSPLPWRRTFVPGVRTHRRRGPRPILRTEVLDGPRLRT